MKKILLITIILIGLHSLLISFSSNIPSWGINQFQENTIKIEKLLFDSQNCDIAILGSSISTRFEDKVLPPKTCNFALSGDSAVTLLTLIRDYKIPFKKIIIETNVLKPESKQTVNDIVGFPLYFLKSHLSFLRIYNQPMNLTYSFLKSRNNPRRFTELYNESVFKLAMKEHLKTSEKVNIDLKVFYELKQLIQDIRMDKAVLVYFPINSELQNSNHWKEQKTMVNKYFPQTVNVACDPETTDGLHPTNNMVDNCLNSMAPLFQL